MAKSKLSDLRVWYGFAKLTKKIVRKKELAVYFENGKTRNDRKDRYLNQKIHVVYVRFQTIDEASMAEGKTRQFTKYGMFIDEKPWKGNIEKVLENNFLADENHVSFKEREIIRQKMRDEYYKFYKVEKKPIGQQQIIFY